MSQSFPWWRGAVVYQVYIRSFMDSNGDGVGDFPGLVSRLDYIASLGADAIWLSPIHPSPNRDWGYDVSDYDTVNPEYGAEDDFDRLLTEAHARGLKVLTDEVFAHTSDEHPWFRKSLRGGEKADWYVWAQPRDDGTVPNNWLSAFGGPAWSYHPSRRQYYHHKFLRQQPKLNLHHPKARASILRIMDAWLARGVDGFRLDVANAFLHDESLTDNPSIPETMRQPRHWASASNMQVHNFDGNLEENIVLLNEIRRRVERHPDRFVMGEFSEDAERSGGLAPPTKGLHSGYTFPLLNARKLGPDFVRDHYENLARYIDHWPSVGFSNHDVIRTVTRFGGREATPALARLMLAVLACLRGTILLYQGEELGLPETELRRDQLKDPVGDLYFPRNRGRDGCRTPMPWDAPAPNLGFTIGTPWLPVSPEHKPLAVSEQESDASSTLAFARRALALRRISPALRVGEIEFLDAHESVLGFTRRYPGERLLCIFNMSRENALFQDTLVSAVESVRLETPGIRVSGGTLELPPCAVFVGAL